MLIDVEGDILRLVASGDHVFSEGFGPWLKENFHVWEEFERRANRVYGVRQHYSARTIIESIRHDSAIRELSGQFKINNNSAPDLARLYTVIYPARSGFFETRGR